MFRHMRSLTGERVKSDEGFARKVASVAVTIKPFLRMCSATEGSVAFERRLSPACEARSVPFRMRLARDLPCRGGAFERAWPAHQRFPASPVPSRQALWRNRRAVGYQGLSSRSRSQRQSGTKGSMIQTGFPMAPARCATAVSTEITRSRLATAPAVCAKSVSSAKDR